MSGICPSHTKNMNLSACSQSFAGIMKEGNMKIVGPSYKSANTKTVDIVRQRDRSW